MKQLAIINPENSTEEEVKSYRTRDAARAVVVDDEKNIALLHVSNMGYYKLPGGGIEGTEDKIVSLQRECREEIGCELEVITEIGMIVEYVKNLSLVQTSYCYFAKVIGGKGEPHFTEKEVREGFKTLWIPYSEVLKTMESVQTDNREGTLYIVPRDSIFLKEANDYVSKYKNTL